MTLPSHLTSLIQINLMERTEKTVDFPYDETANGIYADFYLKLARNVYVSPSSYWVEVQRGMLFSFPFYRLIAPPQDEIDHLIRESNVLGVRYPTLAEGFGFQSSRIMCRRLDYGIDDLKSKARNQLRKGEKNFDIRQVPRSDLASSGLELYRKTLARQGRDDPKSDDYYWTRLCEACYKVDGVKVYGAYHHDRLSAYMIVLETPAAAEIIMQNSDSDMLSLCPNNILAYTVTNHYLSQTERPIPVCYGLGSLEATQSLDHFKIAMGYDFETIKQAIVFAPKLRPFLNRRTLTLLGFLQNKLFRRSYFVRKCHGLLSCYLNQTTGTNDV